MNTNVNNTGQVQQKPLRLWPGVIIVILQWMFRFGFPRIFPGDKVLMLGVFAGIICALALALWWLFFSRAPRFERWSAIVLIIGALFVTSRFLDVSIRTANMGLMFMIYSVPVMCLAFVVWAVASRHLSNMARRTTMVMTIFFASGMWIFLRTNGMDAELHHDLAWRWAKTSEERLMAREDNKLVTMPLDSATLVTKTEWPGFRGANRDAIIHSIRIGTDWLKNPPVEMWRRSVGPGCSSFAVHGDLLYTQEQRGEYEMVTCYSLKTGQPIWRHTDKARFWDSHAGAGPRSTPTFYNDRIYTLGATGILNVLNASNGSVIWSRDAATDTGVKVLPWGFTSSPLVIDDMVIIALSGKMAAYDKASGKPVWTGPDGGNSYSSPHLVSIDGVSQVLLMSKKGVVSIEPARGKQLWNYDWPIDNRILQPAVIKGGDLLIAGEGKGVRRITVSHSSDDWTVKELWTSEEMKLNFNDFIIHKGFAYGFDGPRIACIDINDGKLKWRGNPYRGWLLLLADQDLLLLLSEKGDLAIVEASPVKFTELGRIPAIKGKTWNHPVLAGDILVARNNVEMVAFRMWGTYE